MMSSLSNELKYEDEKGELTKFQTIYSKRQFVVYNQILVRIKVK